MTSPHHILVLGDSRPLHERLQYADALPHEAMVAALASWSAQGGPADILLGITRFNLFKLPQLWRFLIEHCPSLETVPPLALDPRPLANVHTRFAAAVERTTAELRQRSVPVRLLVCDDGLPDLLRGVQDLPAAAEGRALRALGAVCETALRGPTRVLIDLTNVCNTNCAFCRAHTEAYDRRMKPASLDSELLEQVLADMRDLGVEEVSLVGSGEPSLHPFLPEFLRLSSDYGIGVDLSINGIRLPDELLASLMSPSVHSITVSVSGPTAASYESVHPGHGDDFAKVKANCERLSLARARCEARAPDLIMLHCVNRHTVDELRQMVELCADVEFDSVWLQMLHVDPGTAHLALSPDQAAVLPDQLAEARAYARKIGVTFNDYIAFQVEHLDPDDGTWSKQAMPILGCYVGWFFTYLDVHAHIAFCCGLKNIARLGPGRRIKDIWFSEPYDHMRRCAKFLAPARNLESPDNAQLHAKRFLFDEFCACCDNHNFNQLIQQDLTETRLDRFLLPLVERPFPEIASVSVKSDGLADGTFAPESSLTISVAFSNRARWPRLFPTIYGYQDRFLLFEIEGPAVEAESGAWSLIIPSPPPIPDLRIVAGLGVRECGLKRLFSLTEPSRLRLATPPSGDPTMGWLEVAHQVRAEPAGPPDPSVEQPILIEAIGSGPPRPTPAWCPDLEVRVRVRTPASGGRLSVRLVFEHVGSGYIPIASFSSPVDPGSQRVTFAFPAFPLVGDYRVLARLVDPSGAVLGTHTASHTGAAQDAAAGSNIVRFPFRWNSVLSSGFGADAGTSVCAETLRPAEPSPVDADSGRRGAPGELEVFFEPLKIDIAITQRCNFRCLMCECWKSPGSREMPAGKWSEMIRRARDLTPLKLVCIGGGEPLLKRDVLDVVRTCSQLSVFAVMVTNGSLISEQNASAIVEAGLDVLSISIDGFSEVHDALRGVPGAFDRAMRAARAIRACGGKTRCGVSAFICEQNLDDIIRLTEHVNDLPFLDGINFQALQQVTSYHGAQWYRESPLWPKDAARAAAVIEQLVELKRQGLNIHNPEPQLRRFAAFYRDPSGTSFKMLCKAGYSALPLDARGDVHLCPKVPSIGNVFESALRDLYLGPAASAVRRMSATCEEKCHFLVNCYEEHRDNR
jgi:MoaA/NifB/PqqE/SkfB family radical SAM enzyme